MDGSRSKADITDRSDRTGPQCSGVAGGSVGATVRWDFSASIRPQRPIRPPAHRKRPRSSGRVFQSICGAGRQQIVRNRSVAIRLPPPA